MTPYLDTAPETQSTIDARTRPARPIRRPSSRKAAPIIAAVCERYGVAFSDLMSKRKWRTLSEARQAAMWLLRREGYSYPEIGILLNRDHTTVMYGVARVEADVEADEGLRAELVGILDGGGA